MSVDISTELVSIRNEEKGRLVLMAIQNAAAAIAETGTADISAELSVLQNGRYGIEIRAAIAGALEKLANAAPVPAGGDGAVGGRLPVYNGADADAVIGGAETEE